MLTHVKVSPHSQMMKTTDSQLLTLRQAFAELQSLPLYVSAVNTVSIERGEEIAAKFGIELADVQRDFDLANRYGQEAAKTRPDTQGNGQGMHVSAEHLFYGYVYEENRVNLAADREAARNERDYD